MSAKGEDVQRNVVERVRVGAPGVPTDVPFVIGATAVLAICGALLEGGGIVGLRLEDAPFAAGLPGWGVRLLGAWMASAAVVGLALPLAALSIWGRHASIRRALLPYVLMLVFQIFVEILFARLFVPNIVVLTGLVFTGYRLWQLRAARRSLRESAASGRSAVCGLLVLGLWFWTANLLFLALIALPKVLEFG